MAKTFLFSSLTFSAVLGAISIFIFFMEPVPAIAEQENSKQVTPAISNLTGSIEPLIVEGTPNVSTIQNKIFFSGQPDAASFINFRAKGVTTVINLRTEGEMKSVGFDESKLTESLGMKYINIPIGRDEPSKETIATLMKTLDSSENGTILMHCASSSRVGYVWAMYRGTRTSDSADTALAKGKAAGMNSPLLDERANSHIQQHKENSN